MTIPEREAAVLAVACFVLSSTVQAAPSLNFPISSQVPPVARVSQQFSFTFADSTFIGSEELISYALLNAPFWLRLDSDTRTFSGNVDTNDTGTARFGLIASDTTGSTSSDVDLIITDSQGLQLRKDVLPQLSKTGATSAPSSLLTYPLQAFEANFTPDTFSHVTKATIFYATSADNSPLPSWLQFDAANLRFSGTSPPLVSRTAQPQHYGVRLIASNTAGFAEAIARFQIVVGYQVLAFAEASHSVEVWPEVPFETEPLRNSLTLDGDSIRDGELALVTSNASDWAELDMERILLRGIPPRGATTQNILIEVSDVHGNVANTTVTLAISGSQDTLFRTGLSPVNATTGKSFRYVVDPGALSSNDVQVTADLSNVSSWLKYDTTSRTFSGTVPKSLQPGPISIELNATRGSSSERDTLIVNVVSEALLKTPSHTSRALPSSTNNVAANGGSPSEGPSRNNRTMVIVLGILIPLITLFCLAILVLYCRRRRKQKHFKHRGQSPPKIISRPILPSAPEHVNETKGQAAFQPEDISTPTSPPRIELPWAPESLRKSKDLLLKATTNRESTLVDSGWGDFVIHDTPEPARNSKQLQQPVVKPLVGSGDWTPFVRSNGNNLNYSRKRTPFRPTQSKVQKPSLSSRASQRLSGLSTMNVGLPGRLSGAGHGAGGPGPPDFRDVRPFWRNSGDILSSEDGRTTSFDLGAFPTPPAGERSTLDESREQTVRASIRFVRSSSSHSGSLADQRQKWVKDRARDRYEQGLSFSHPWSSRAHSRANGLDSTIRSPSRTKFGSLDLDEALSRRNTERSWSRSSSIGIPVRPETVMRMKSPDSHLVRQPSNLRRALSTISSGRVDSVESKSNSSWMDDLIEEEDEAGNRRWVAVDNIAQWNSLIVSPGLQGGEGSEQGSWGRSSRTGGLGALRANIHGVSPAVGSGDRRWRLGDQQAKRPVSVDEGELQRCQGSQRGNMAFI